MSTLPPKYSPVSITSPHLQSHPTRRSQFLSVDDFNGFLTGLPVSLITFLAPILHIAVRVKFQKCKWDPIPPLFKTSQRSGSCPDLRDLPDLTPTQLSGQIWGLSVPCSQCSTTMPFSVPQTSMLFPASGPLYLLLFPADNFRLFGFQLEYYLLKEAFFIHPT